MELSAAWPLGKEGLETWVQLGRGQWFSLAYIMKSWKQTNKQTKTQATETGKVMRLDSTGTEAPALRTSRPSRLCHAVDSFIWLLRAVSIRELVLKCKANILPSTPVFFHLVCGRLKSMTILVCSTSQQEVDFSPPLLQFGLVVWLPLANRMWQKCLERLHPFRTLLPSCEGLQTLQRGQVILATQPCPVNVSF